MKKTTIRVDLRIMGDILNIQDITGVFKINPTEIWKVGDSIRNSGKKRTYSAWIYSTGADETLSVNTQVKKIYDIFLPKINELVSMQKEYKLDVSIDVVIVIENQLSPAIYLDSSIIKFASLLNASFDIDTYVN